MFVLECHRSFHFVADFAKGLIDQCSEWVYDRVDSCEDRGKFGECKDMIQYLPVGQSVVAFNAFVKAGLVAFAWFKAEQDSSVVILLCLRTKWSRPRLMLSHPLVPTCHGEAGFGWRTAETTCSVRVDH